jgi:L-lysine 2,3-aminomutase
MDTEMTTSVHNITKLKQVQGLSDCERTELAPVVDKFAFGSNDYYLSLIDWNDPNDPIRRAIIPHVDELDKWGWLEIQQPSFL